MDTLTLPQSSCSASLRSLPAYLPPLDQRIHAVHQAHSVLSSRLDQLGNIPEKIQENQTQTYTVNGKLTSQRTRLKTLESICKENYQIHTCMSDSFAKRFINKHGSRARLFRQAEQDLVLASDELQRHRQLVTETECILQRLETDHQQLQLENLEYHAIVKQLDSINHSLFAGPTPEFPQEDQLEWQLLVLQEIQVLLASESNREKRARQLLKQAIPSLNACIKGLQKALEQLIDAGIPQNQKYTSQLFNASSSATTVKATKSLLLNVKTNSGKFHTTIAKARVSQRLVQGAPEFRLIELHHMPGSKNPKAVNERGLHCSLETSYSQAKACDAYLKSEIQNSLQRQNKLALETQNVEKDINKTKIQLRSLRRELIRKLIEGGDMSESVSNLAEVKPSPFAAPDQQQLELRNQALAKLRSIITLPPPQEDDDYLYPVAS